jgi:hypothetical protein
LTKKVGTATGPGLRFSSLSINLKRCFMPSVASPGGFHYSRQLHTGSPPQVPHRLIFHALIPI